MKKVTIGYRLWATIVRGAFQLGQRNNDGDNDDNETRVVSLDIDTMYKCCLVSSLNVRFRCHVRTLGIVCRDTIFL